MLVRTYDRTVFGHKKMKHWWRATTWTESQKHDVSKEANHKSLGIMWFNSYDSPEEENLEM